MIEFRIESQRLTIKQPLVASDTSSYITAECHFSSDWDGYQKWCHFSKGGAVYDIQIEDDKIVKAKKVDLTAGNWNVYFSGHEIVSGQSISRITTNVDVVRVVKSGVVAQEPFPSIPASAGEQIVATATEKANIATTKAGEAAASATSAQTAYQNVLAIDSEVEEHIETVEALLEHAKEVDEEVEEHLEKVETLVTGFDTHVATAKGQITTAKNSAITEIGQAKTTALSDIDCAKTSAVSDVQSQGTSIITSASSYATQAQESAETASAKASEASASATTATTQAGYSRQFAEVAAQASEEASESATSASASATTATTQAEIATQKAQEISSSASTISQHSTEIAELQEDVATNTSKIKADEIKLTMHEKRIENLEFLTEKEDHIVNDSSSAYQITVPNNTAPNNALNKIGAKPQKVQKAVRGVVKGNTTKSYTMDTSTLTSVVRSGNAEHYFDVGDEIVVSNTIKFDVMDFDTEDIVDTSKTHSMPIMLKDVYSYGSLPFCNGQLMYWARDGLSAGTYYFRCYRADYNCTNNDYYMQFTIAQDIVAGGGFKHNRLGVYQSNSANYSKDYMLGGSITTYSAMINTNGIYTRPSIETVSVTEGKSGTYLGCFSAEFYSGYTTVDALHNATRRNGHGNNRWDTSYHRQWLNSSVSANVGWYTPKSNFDMPPSEALQKWAGFLNGIDADFVNAIGTTKQKCATGSWDRGMGESDYYITEDKIFYASMTNMNQGNNNGVAEGSAWKYWRDHNTNADRIKYQGTTARYWWLRSCLPSDCYYNRTINTIGALGSSLAIGSVGVVPACVIV